MLKHGRTQKPPEVAQAELQQFWSGRKQLQESKLEKWSQVDIGGKELIKLYNSNPQKARNVSMAIDNQERALKRMSETVMATAFGTSLRPENFLKAVYIGTANSKRGDIFTEFPLQSVDDALFYIYMNRTDALRGAVAGDRIYETINQYYEGETYTGNVGSGNGATLTFTSAAMSPLALIPWSIRILVDGAQVAVDNGSGTLVGATLDTTGTNTVSYSTGVITVTFSAGNAPATGTNNITAIYNWNSEDSGNFTYLGKVGIELVKTRFSARPMPLGYSITDMTQVLFDTSGIGDAKEYLTRAVGHEHAKARDFRAIARARQVALGNTSVTFDTDFASAGEISFKSHAQRVLNEIEKVGATIYDDIQRGQINKIVAGAKATTYLKNHELWKDDTTDPRTGVYKSGMLSDIEIYTCPANSGLVATNEMLLTYKNPEEGLDLSLVFGVLTEISAELRYPQQYTEGYSSTIEDSKTINSKFVRRMTLSNLS